MAVNLVELVSNAITPDAVQGMSRVLGESDSTVKAGIGSLVPTLLGGMAAKASAPSGASSLLETINGSGVDAGLAGNIGNMLGSGESGALLQQGSTLLGGLFGTDKAASISGALAGMTGMKTGSATGLLTMVVPLVLGVLKKFFGENRLGPGEVTSLFAGQKQFLEGKLDPRLTSAMGLGSPANLLSGLGATATDTARGAAAAAAGRAGATATAATAAATSGTSRWMPWALAAVVAAVVLTMLPRFGRDREASVAKAPAPTATTPAPTSPTAAAPPTEAPASPTAAAPPIETPASPPPATAMGAAPATLPAKIYFDTGQSELGPDGSAIVKSVAGMLATDPSAKVDLTGFTDKTGNTAANEDLAKRRAAAVKAGLEAAGVAPDRVNMKAPMSVEVGAGGSDKEARRVEIAAATK